MILEQFEAHHHSLLSAWWALKSWPVIPLDHLPKNGLIVKSGETHLAAGFLYLTDSKIAWLEFIVGNPLCDKIERGKALDLIIKALLEVAKENDKSTVFTSCQHQGLMKRYEASGAVRTEENMTNFVWSI